MALTIVSFFGATVYMHRTAIPVDDYAISIATNASPSIEKLSAARGEVRELELLSTRALASLATGGNADGELLGRAEARLHADLSAYLALPFYPGERSHYAEVERALAALERQIAILEVQVSSGNLPRSRATLREGIAPAAAHLDRALQFLVGFNADEQHRMGLEIPILRRRAAHIGYALEGIAALLAIFLMGLITTGIRRYVRVVHQQRRLTQEQAEMVARFSRRLRSVVDASVRISEAVSRSPHEPRAIYQAIVDEARAVLKGDYCALGYGMDAERPFDPWVFSGMSEDEAKAVGRTPRPVGLLGAVVRRGEPIRVPDLKADPVFRGLPKHHPDMGPFLGIPVHHDAVGRGHLYVTRKCGGVTFTAEDEQVGQLLAAQAAVAAENANLYRLATDASHRRDEVLGIVSHDLRNPVASIQLLCQQLRRARKTDEKVIDLSQRISRAAERILGIINDLLDVAKIEGGLSIQAQPEAVDSLLDEVMDMFKVLAADKQIRLSVSAREHSWFVLCERGRLLQVFSNLVGNALKFTPSGGRVTVCAELEGEDAHFSVEDSGPGIPVEEVPHLFERYWQAKREEGRGAGLGLYIVKGIVEAHGGRVWVNSRIGSGSTFYFTAPASRLGPGADSCVQPRRGI